MRTTMTRKITHWDRLNRVHTQRIGALSAFTKAADDLEAAASQYRTLADTASDEAAERTIIADAALVSASDALDKAQKIRDLIG